MNLKCIILCIFILLINNPVICLDKHIKWIRSGHAVPINYTTYLNNNSLAVSTDVSGYLKLWNLDSNRIDDFYKVSYGSPMVYPTNDSSNIIIQYDNQFTLINIDGKIIKSKILNKGILSYDLTENRDLIAISYFYKNVFGGKDPGGEYGCGVEIWDFKNDSIWYIKQTYKVGRIGDIVLPTIFDRFVSFSSDEKIIAVSNDSGYVNFFQVSDGKYLKSIKLYSDTITSMFFKDDILIISDNHGNLKVWEYPTGNLLYDFNKYQDINSTIKTTEFLLKNNKYIITYKNPNHDSIDVIYLWDAEKNNFDDSVKINIKGLKYYTLSNDCKRMLCILKNNELVEKNLLDTNKTQKLSLNYGAINSIDFNDSLLIAAYSNNDIKIHSKIDGEIISTITDTSGIPCNVLITNDSKKIFSSIGSIIKKWDKESKQEDFRILRNYTITSLALNKEESILFSTQVFGENCPWYTNTGKYAYGCFFHYFDGLGETGNLYVSPNGNQLAFTISDHGSYHVNFAHIPGNVFKSMNIYYQSAAISKLCYYSDDRIVFGNSGGDIQIWEIGKINGDEKLVKTFKAHIERVTGVVVNSDSTVLISSGTDGYIKFWNLYNYQNVCSIFVKTQINVIKLINDNSLLVATEDGNFVMYDIDEFIKATQESSTPDPEISNLFFKIYPNPVFDFVNFQFNLPSITQIKIEIIDIFGKIIKRFNFNNENQGINQVNLDLSDIETGFYFAKMTLNNKEQNFIVLKFIKN